MSSWHPGLVKSPVDWTQHQNGGVWHSLCSLGGDALRCFLLLHPSSGFLAIVWGGNSFLSINESPLEFYLLSGSVSHIFPKAPFSGATLQENSSGRGLLSQREASSFGEPLCQHQELQ